MPGGERYICVDWGLSRLRASLCEFAGGASIVQDTLSGPGIMTARHSIEDILFETVAPWMQQIGQVPILLAGGVWSNIGWRTTPYVACPFTIKELAGHCTTFTARGCDIVIVPGLECTNSFGETDTMRGEELQMLGWLQADPSKLSGVHLVCLPGTHTKWVLIEDGRIRNFQTAVTGELYALMLEHSVLLAQQREPEAVAAMDAEAFALGVAACRAAKGAVSHALFSARSRLLKQQLSADGARSYLSGMLIAADVIGALESLKPPLEPVSLVGEPALCERFSTALDAFDLETETLDGNIAATQGFSIVYQSLYQQERDRSASV